VLQAPKDVCLAISYNPGNQSVLTDLKQSTRQRFVALELDYPSSLLEQKILHRNRSWTAARRRAVRALAVVAPLTSRVSPRLLNTLQQCNHLLATRSGQLRFLG